MTQEESEELVAKVLAEIGCSLSADLVNAPGGGVDSRAAVAAAPSKTAIAEGGGGIDNELQARLDNLRRL